MSTSANKMDQKIAVMIVNILTNVVNLTAEERTTCANIVRQLWEVADEPGKYNFREIAVGAGEFAIIFRETQGAQAMLDYIEWARRNREVDSIFPTVMHDIRGRREQFFSPRTESYLGIGLVDEPRD